MLVLSTNETHLTLEHFPPTTDYKTIQTQKVEKITLPTAEHPA